MDKMYTQIFQNYGAYLEPVLRNRLFKHAEIRPLIEALNRDVFEVKVLGRSFEGREIFCVKWGSGPVQVLLWSQMHGDEPTSTMAFFDLFRFLQAEDQFQEIRDKLQNALTLHFIPMLNPDGAERYQRRNALEIDLNRDAIRLQCPESRILSDYREEIQAHWAFNMHDQRKYYTVGHSHETATISFLAPSYNVDRDVNTNRKEAMQVIIGMHKLLRQFIPGKIARYTDKYYPRSFGDNFQRFGTRSILVESGGMHGDPEKQQIRKLHLLLLLKGFVDIATKAFRRYDRYEYDSIPENTELLHDLIIRNATLEKDGIAIQVDLAFKTEEIAHEEHWDFYHNSSLVDMGDLSIFKGYEEFDASGYRIVPGRLYHEIFYAVDSVQKERYMNILKEGFTEIRVKQLPDNAPLLGLPVRLIPEHESPKYALQVGKNPSIFLVRDNRKEYAVINGFLRKLD